LTGGYALLKLICLNEVSSLSEYGSWKVWLLESSLMSLLTEPLVISAW